MSKSPRLPWALCFCGLRFVDAFARGRCVRSRLLDERERARRRRTRRLRALDSGRDAIRVRCDRARRGRLHRRSQRPERELEPRLPLGCTATLPQPSGFDSNCQRPDKCGCHPQPAQCEKMQVDGGPEWIRPL